MFDFSTDRDKLVLGYSSVKLRRVYQSAPAPSCLLLPGDAHGLLGEPRLLLPRAVHVGVRVLQRQEGVGGDGALALSAGQQVDGQLGGGGGGEGLQLLEVLLLLHEPVEQRLLLILRGGGDETLAHALRSVQKKTSGVLVSYG